MFLQKAITRLETGPWITVPLYLFVPSRLECETVGGQQLWIRDRATHRLLLACQNKKGRRMKRFIGLLCLAISMAGFVTLPPARAQTNPAAASAPAAASVKPPGFPANLRWDLVPKWIQWVNDAAQISWPPKDGCASTPVAQSLTAGQMIDRFGSDHGSFFSPRGASFRSRAVPYVCPEMDYWVYRVVKPIAVKTCKAAPWFGEPGGAVQVETAEPAFKLQADHMIEVVSHAVGGSGRPAPQCRRP